MRQHRAGSSWNISYVSHFIVYPVSKQNTQALLRNHLLKTESKIESKYKAKKKKKALRNKTKCQVKRL